MEASDQHDMSHLIELYKAAKYNELIVLLKDLLDKDENNTKARSLIAASYMALGKRTEAIQNLLKLIELEPNSANHHYNLGIAYGSIGNKTLARKSFESALELDPDNQKAKHQLSLLSSKPNNDIALSGMPIGNPQSSHTAAPESIEPAAPSPNPVNNVSAPPPETYMPTYQNPAEGYVRLLGSSKANVPGGLNWGGFFIPFIWSLGHKAWLLALISFFFSPFAALYLLFKGNEIAWLEGDYSTHEDFRRIERV